MSIWGVTAERIEVVFWTPYRMEGGVRPSFVLLKRQPARREYPRPGPSLFHSSQIS